MGDKDWFGGEDFCSGDSGQRNSSAQLQDFDVWCTDFSNSASTFGTAPNENQGTRSHDTETFFKGTHAQIMDFSSAHESDSSYSRKSKRSRRKIIRPDAISGDRHSTGRVAHQKNGIERDFRYNERLERERRDFSKNERRERRRESKIQERIEVGWASEKESEREHRPRSRRDRTSKRIENKSRQVHNGTKKAKKKSVIADEANSSFSSTGESGQYVRGGSPQRTSERPKSGSPKAHHRGQLWSSEHSQRSRERSRSRNSPQRYCSERQKSPSDDPAGNLHGHTQHRRKALQRTQSYSIDQVDNIYMSESGEESADDQRKRNMRSKNVAEEKSRNHHRVGLSRSKSENFDDVRVDQDRRNKQRRHSPEKSRRSPLKTRAQRHKSGHLQQFGGYQEEYSDTDYIGPPGEIAQRIHEKNDGRQQQNNNHSLEFEAMGEISDSSHSTRERTRESRGRNDYRSRGRSSTEGRSRRDHQRNESRRRSPSKSEKKRHRREHQRSPSRNERVDEYAERKRDGKTGIQEGHGEQERSGRRSSLTGARSVSLREIARESSEQSSERFHRSSSMRNLSPHQKQHLVSKEKSRNRGTVESKENENSRYVSPPRQSSLLGDDDTEITDEEFDQDLSPEKSPRKQTQSLKVKDSGTCNLKALVSEFKYNPTSSSGRNMDFVDAIELTDSESDLELSLARLTKSFSTDVSLKHHGNRGSMYTTCSGASSLEMTSSPTCDNAIVEKYVPDNCDSKQAGCKSEAGSDSNEQNVPEKRPTGKHPKLKMVRTDSVRKKMMQTADGDAGTRRVVQRGVDAERMGAHEPLHRHSGHGASRKSSVMRSIERSASTSHIASHSSRRTQKDNGSRQRAKLTLSRSCSDQTDEHINASVRNEKVQTNSHSNSSNHKRAVQDDFRSTNEVHRSCTRSGERCNSERAGTVQGTSSKLEERRNKYLSATLKNESTRQVSPLRKSTIRKLMVSAQGLNDEGENNARKHREHVALSNKCEKNKKSSNNDGVEDIMKSRRLRGTETGTRSRPGHDKNTEKSKDPPTSRNVFATIISEDK